MNICLHGILYANIFCITFSRAVYSGIVPVRADSDI